MTSIEEMLSWKKKKNWLKDGFFKKNFKKQTIKRVVKIQSMLGKKNKLMLKIKMDIFG